MDRATATPRYQWKLTSTSTNSSDKSDGSSEVNEPIQVVDDEEQLSDVQL